MRSRRLFVALVVSLSCSGVTAAAPRCAPTGDPESDAGLRRVEQRWVAALDARDVAALGCLLDPSFVDSDWRGGVRTGPQVLAELPQRQKYAQRLEIEGTRIVGDVGLVNGLNRLSDPQGKEVASVRFTDVFVYRGGAWIALAAQETLVRSGSG